MALYQEWRPYNFKQVSGQQHIVRTLVNSLRNGTLHHAYLFYGTRGTGKTSIARIFGRALNCLHEDVEQRPCGECECCIHNYDLHEMDAASNSKIDDARHILDKIIHLPNEGQYSIYIIDEVHRLSAGAFDVLLKSIEEPPEHVVFILATTDLEAVPDTIKSRCMRMDFRRLSVKIIVRRLTLIAKHEGIQVHPDALHYIADLADGSMRDAISLFEQALAQSEDGEISLNLVEEGFGSTNQQSVKAIIDAYAQQDARLTLRALHRAMQDGNDPDQLSKSLIQRLRQVMVFGITDGEGIEYYESDADFYVSILNRVPIHQLRTFIEVLLDCQDHMKNAMLPMLPIETAIIQTLPEIISPHYVEVEVQAIGRIPMRSFENEEILIDERVTFPPMKTIPVTIELDLWEEVIRRIERSAPAARKVLSAFAIAHQDEYELWIDSPNEVLKDKMNQRMLDMIQWAVNEVIGSQLRVGMIKTIIPEPVVQNVNTIDPNIPPKSKPKIQSFLKNWRKDQK